ncbi:MAG TPA: sigma-54 dependent transcriptional regulator [Blastocatellia bacterium]|jgi:DNA-binding NtrC family response regulator|nr:sigma-54 dependent transcriptional regulator [Blastocatellia bacterium]
MKKILVIDDDGATCDFLSEIFTEEGWRVLASQSADSARAAVAENRFDLIVSDINLGGRTNGVALLKEFKTASPESEVILISGFGTLETAVEAVREGAFDYISKPFDVNAVVATARRALKGRDQGEPAAVLLKAHGEASGLIGHSPKMIEIYKQIAVVAPSRTTVLITGESGVGKELVARALHRNSPRSSGPFIAINCGALTESLLESELFGHTRGSFTGAVSDKRGLFEEAGGGTLFLDEIGETSLALQVKLLRVLQESEVRRVGSAKSVRIDARVIAATNRDLEREVREGRFREDLYYRLSVVVLEVAPLRERREDIPLLAANALKRAVDSGAKITSTSEEALALLEAYSWPGNVRELENTLERAALYARGSVITPEDLPEKIRDYSRNARRAESAARLEEMFEGLPSLDELERRYLLHVLQQVGGSRTRAAEVMGIDRRTLYRMAERFGLKLKDSE